MSLADSIENLEDMSESLCALPRLNKMEEYKQVLFPGSVVAEKKEKIYAMLKPFLEEIGDSITAYQSRFTKKALLDARERYETIKQQVNLLESCVGREGIMDKALEVKKLCEKRDVLRKKQRLSGTDFNMDEKQLRAALELVKNGNSTCIPDEFSTVIIGDMLKNVAFPSEREIKSLLSICEVLEN